ncbi:capsule biosynthesis GfcC family protein [Luteimonas aquatica]|uniref:capsule biosynthesis GfcC family protein n=1 Tax=Luteimonas aquatica TaxID=450364 RepID=UPI001F59C658|nr:capsule biosynthesis GfcC family protein [Luteimonas aquatica]
MPAMRIGLRRHGAAWLAAALALSSAGTALSQVRVMAEGEVDAPGEHLLENRARLDDAALAAKARPHAYLAGAAWLRPALIPQQTRLKAGLLFDLELLARLAGGQGNDRLVALATGLAAQLRAMPVTGRQVALLDGRVLEVAAAANLPVADGDRLVYPARPRTVRVVGAVERECALPHVALRDARLYLPDCALAPDADVDTIQVIQPDGRVFEQGIALWNRGPPVPLAPGAVLYVPLRARLIDPVDPVFNREMAEFLATQPLRAEAGAP